MSPMNRPLYLSERSLAPEQIWNWDALPCDTVVVLAHLLELDIPYALSSVIPIGEVLDRITRNVEPIPDGAPIPPSLIAPHLTRLYRACLEHFPEDKPQQEHFLGPFRAPQMFGDCTSNDMAEAIACISGSSEINFRRLIPSSVPIWGAGDAHRLIPNPHPQSTEIQYQYLSAEFRLIAVFGAHASEWFSRLIYWETGGFAETARFYPRPTSSPTRTVKIPRHSP